MESVEDLLVFHPPAYHQNGLSRDDEMIMMNVNVNRTPSPSSSSSSSSDNEANNVDTFYSGLLSTNTNLNPNLDMDLLVDSETMDLFEELQKDEQRLREELIFSNNAINPPAFLTDNTGEFVLSPESFNGSSSPSSLSSPCTPFFLQNDSSNSCETSTSASSSVNGDHLQHSDVVVNECQVQVQGQGQYQGYDFMDFAAVSPSMESPPLTPPELKADTSVIYQSSAQSQLLLPEGVILGTPVTIDATNIVPVSSTSHQVSNTTLLPSLKSNKRGRSASHDDTPDVQALKRHIRMIRNRESASLSRKKKKDYVTNLETKVKELEVENDALKKENHVLRSRLQLSDKTNTTPLSSNLPTPSGQKKGRVGVVAKVALLSLFGFVMINFQAPGHHPPLSDHSNMSDFSRTLVKVEPEEVENEFHGPLLARQRRFIPKGYHFEEPHSLNNTIFSLGNGNLSLSAPLPNTTFGSNVTSNFNKSIASADGSNMTTVTKPSIPLRGYHDYGNATQWSLDTPTSYLNGSAYNEGFPNKTAHDQRNLKREHSRWRSRGVKKNWKSLNSNSSWKAATWVFPPFLGSPEARNISSPEIKPGRCPNYFNKTESMRVKNNLDDIFGKDKISTKPKPLSRTEPIVFSLAKKDPKKTADSVPMPSFGPDNGLTVYEGQGQKFANILDKLERREDTFYVVSLASENQLLLGAKASNESSRPKMTLLLPWRNETLNEDMILQIDCEVFQVYNLNENNKKKRSSNSKKRSVEVHH